MKTVLDISFWQDKANFDVMHLNGADGVILRAGQGSWEDKRFRQFRADAQKVMPFGSYWYYDNNYAPKRQAELYASIIGDNYGTLGAWLDLEDSKIGSYGTWRHWADFIEYFKQFSSAPLGIYTRASYIDGKIQADKLPYFAKHPLWVAHYNALTPKIPKGWTDWLLWQYTDSGDGYAFGVGSREVDMNRYKGDIAPPPDNVSMLQAKFGDVSVEYKKV